MATVSNKTLEVLKYDLVRDGYIKYEDLEKADELASSQNVNIGSVLIKIGLITEEKLLKFLENKLQTPYVDLKDYTPDEKCVSMITYTEARKYKIIPLFKIENVLTVAMADPLDLFAIDKIVEKTGCEIEPVVSAESLVLKKIEEYYKNDAEVAEIDTDSEAAKYDWKNELHSETVSDEHVKHLIRCILKQAVLNGVHELFFENTSEGLRVKMKYGSEIVDTGLIPSVLTVMFISCLKIAASMDANVCELPQAGKINFKAENMLLTAVVSAFPTINGERISLKIYKPPRALKEYGLSENRKAMIIDAIQKPGIILVCGPSTSGKTHFVYSLISEIADGQKNIMTVESVAKYNLENVNQCELNENIGFNTDKVMRFIEFQSPDVIYAENIMTRTALDYFCSLVLKDKVIITEFPADNVTDLHQKLAYEEFEMFKPLVSAMVFVHGENKTEIFDKNDIRKFIG